MQYIWVIIVIVSVIMRLTNQAKRNQQKSAPGPAQPGRPQGQAKPQAQPKPQAKPLAEVLGGPAAKPLAQAMQAKPVEKKAHTAKPLETHMHSAAPVMGLEGVGTEGEDCCHEYMLGSTPAEQPANGIVFPVDEDRTPQAQALLQGVIFSEILGRRAPLQYGRKQA